MTARGQQTVRQLRASVLEWAADIDLMARVIGNDHWLDIAVADCNRISESPDVIALLREWGEMAATRLQIASLPERDDEMRMT